MDTETLTLTPPSIDATSEIDFFSEGILDEIDDIDFREQLAEVLNTNESKIIDTSPESNLRTKLRFVEKLAEKGKTFLLEQVLTKKTLSDVVAANILVALLACPQEMLIGGLNIMEFTRGKILGIIPNSLSGGVYGKWRDFVLKKIPEKANDNQLKKFIVDSLISMGFSTMYAPIYMLSLHMAGADFDEIMRSVGSEILLCGITGRLFGLGMEQIRRLFGIREIPKDESIEESLVVEETAIQSESNRHRYPQPAPA